MEIGIHLVNLYLYSVCENGYCSNFGLAKMYYYQKIKEPKESKKIRLNELTLCEHLNK